MEINGDVSFMKMGILEFLYKNRECGSGGLFVSNRDYVIYETEKVVCTSLSNDGKVVEWKIEYENTASPQETSDYDKEYLDKILVYVMYIPPTGETKGKVQYKYLEKKWGEKSIVEVLKWTFGHSCDDCTFVEMK